MNDISPPLKETLMNRLLIGLVLILAAVIGLGFYFGYFHVGAESSDGTTRITLTVDHRKLQADEKKAEEKVHDVTHPSKE